MSTRSVIENYFDVISGKKEGDFIAALSPNITWHLPPHHPFGSQFQGMDKVMGMLARGMPMFREGSLKFQVHTIVVEGDQAFAHFTMTGVTDRDKSYENDYLFRFRVAGDQITEIWESMDTQYMHELGMYEGR